MNIVSCDQEVGRRTIIIRKKGTVTKNVSQSLFPNKRCSKACICGNKSSQIKNIRSCFYLAVLITWCRTAFLQPLGKRCSRSSFYGNKPKFYKNLRSNFRQFLLISWSWPLLLQPLRLIFAFLHKKAIQKSDGQVCFSDGATTTMLILLAIHSLIFLSLVLALLWS